MALASRARHAALLVLALGFLIAAPARALELVMVEQPGCAWCIRWHEELGEIYPRTPEARIAPLRVVQLGDLRRGKVDIKLARPVIFTPTFLLVEDGREIDRIEGYPGQDFFWGLLDRALSAHTDFKPPAS